MYNPRAAQIDQTTQIDDKWRKFLEIVNLNLSEADLSEADLSEANLRGADLRGANLSEADLRGANVQYATFGDNLGISKSNKDKLKDRGAIFEDAPGDRSPIHI